MLVFQRVSYKIPLVGFVKTLGEVYILIVIEITVGFTSVPQLILFIVLFLFSVCLLRPILSAFVYSKSLDGV